MRLREPGKAAEFFGILGDTEDGVAAIGPDLKIIGWNAGATRILGYRSDEALGRECTEIFRGHDRCGNSVCGPQCPGLATLRRGDPVPTGELLAHDRAGRKVWLSVTTLVPPQRYRNECMLVHIFREIALPPELERLISERLRGENKPSPLDVLSLRERQVLRSLAEGLGTQEIASRLSISPATVRNHIQRILGRLKVGSRLEAVAMALRDRSWPLS